MTTTTYSVTAQQFVSNESGNKEKASLNTSLAEAEKIYAVFNEATAKDKKAMADHLSTAYAEVYAICQKQQGKIPDTVYEPLARIAFLYGHCLYGNMEPTRQLFQFSLTIQLVALNAIEQASLPALSDCPKLQDLPAYLEKNEREQKEKGYFEKTLVLLKQEFKPKFFNEISAKSKEETRFRLGMTLRWLGAPYQNLNNWKKEENLSIFQNCYGGATAILTDIKTPDSLWEAAMIVYNCRSFMDKMMKGDCGDIVASWKFLDQILLSDKLPRAAQVRLQIRSIDLVNNSEKIIQKGKGEGGIIDAFKEAQKISEEADKTERLNLFLRTKFRHGWVSWGVVCILAKCDNINVNALRKALQEVIAASDGEHCYHPIYFVTAAKFELSQGQVQQAKTYVERARELMNKHQSSFSQDEKVVKELKVLEQFFANVAKQENKAAS